jgi:YesN/AraC family two-component response regulator
MNNRKKIMIVDDEESLLKSITRFLKIWGYEFDAITSSSLAFKKIENNSKYDLVIMDISMPEMNGINLTRIIKEKYPDLPCIIMTGFADGSNRRESYLAGCDNYILKPFSPMDLKTVIDETLGNAKR